MRRLAAFALAALVATSFARAVDKAPLDRKPPPSAAELKKLAADVEKKARDQDQKDRPARVKVAKNLADMARAESDPGRRYALLDAARDMAAANGDLATAFAAVETMAESFEIDALAECADTLSRAAKSAEGESENTAVCEQGAALLERCVAHPDRKQMNRVVSTLQGRVKQLPAGELATKLAAALEAAPKRVEKQEKAQGALNAAVVKWCAERLGKSIDRGECWDVAHEALRESDADMAACSGYVFGRLLGKKETVLPGDVLILKAVKAKNWHTAPWHVAVVKQVEGLKLTCFHQNWGKNRSIHVFAFDLSTITSGSWYVYRPIAKVAE